MKTQPTSRLLLLGLCSIASTFLAITVSSSANAQAQGDCFSSCGDMFSSASQRNTSANADTTIGTYDGRGYFKKDKTEESSAFSENEMIDPNTFTWSDDPRDVFATSPSDNLQKFPLYKGTMKTFTFTKVSDGQQIEPVYKKSFEPPRAAKPPKWSFGFVGGGNSGPISGDSYTDSFGVTTALFGWQIARQPVKVYFAGDVADARDGLTKRVFIECMRQWCLATKGRLKFTVSEDSRAADIILCRALTSNYELAENNPTFHNGWLDRVKIKLIDSTLDKIGEAQLRAVLLHSAGHAIGYFGHTPDKSSAMNEECSLVYNPTQKLCPCDASYIKEMYDSYKQTNDGTYEGFTIHNVRAPFGKPLPFPSPSPMPIKTPSSCPYYQTHKPMVPAVPLLSLNSLRPKSAVVPGYLIAPKKENVPKSANAHRTANRHKPANAHKSANAPKVITRAAAHVAHNQSAPAPPRLSLAP